MNTAAASQAETATAPPVLVVGSIALDTVQTPFGAVSEALGGAAVYSGVAASFFAPVRLVGVVGDDFPRAHLAALQERGIALAGVEVARGRTFRWSGYYEYDMNQAHTVSTQLNVFENFRPRLPEAYRDSRYVFLANIDPDLQLAVLDQVSAPTLSAADTMNFWIERKRDRLLEVLRRVDVILLNEGEARQLCGTPSLATAGRMLLEMGPKIAVIKKGEHGVMMCAHGCRFAAPSYPLEEVKDPTGAGDSFAGGFVGYLAYTDDPTEENMRKAVVCGSALASFAVQDFSLRRLERLTPEAIMERCSEFRRISHFEEICDLPQARTPIGRADHV